MDNHNQPSRGGRGRGGGGRGGKGAAKPNNGQWSDFDQSNQHTKFKPYGQDFSHDKSKFEMRDRNNARNSQPGGGPPVANMGRGRRNQQQQRPSYEKPRANSKGDFFSCADGEVLKEETRNPRDFFNKVSQQTQDFEIHRIQKKGNDKSDEMVSFKEGEFVIQSKVNNLHGDKHFFIEEELEAEESKEAADCQVIDDQEQHLCDVPYKMCEV